MCERTSSALPTCRNGTGFWTELGRYKKCYLLERAQNARISPPILSSSSHFICIVTSRYGGINVRSLRSGV